jgi:hypothetical protein
MVWIPRRNSPKRKEDNENAVRRALLAGAFAAGASGLLTRKALADTPYTSFAYPLSSLPSMRQATATRTSLQRFADVFNVKDFGALGDHSHDDTAAIQAALNAALDNGGGVVYFPAGNYQITRTLEVGTGVRAGAGAALTLLGAGGDTSFNGGSIIEGSVHGYLLYISQRGWPVKSIQGLVFKNWAEFAFTSAEAPGNPDNLKSGGWEENEEIPASEFNGGGCVYFGTGLATTVINCDFQLVSGIALHCGWFLTYVVGSNFTGAYGALPGQSTEMSFGITTRGGVTLETCKLVALGTAINVYNSGGIEVSALDLEVSGIGIRLGANAVGFHDMDPPQYYPAWTRGGSRKCTIRNSGFESCLVRALEVDNCLHLVLENNTLASYQGNPIDAIWIGWCANSIFRNVEVSGRYTDCAINIAADPDTRIGNLVFENVSAGGIGPGDAAIPIWKLPHSADCYQPGHNPCAFINCNTDGAMPLAKLPVPPNEGPWFISAYPVVINDSVDPLWTGTASNVGKPAVGGGTHKVLVRWNPTLAKWVLAG